MTGISFSELRLIQLAVENVGPFREGLQVIKFQGELVLRDGASQVREAAPSNLFMLLAKNGLGKTTLLECICLLFGLLGNATPIPASSIQLGRGGRAQVDVRVTCTIEDKTQTVLLSISIGDEGPLVPWSAIDLDEIAQASAWAHVAFDVSSGGNIFEASNELGRLIHSHVQANLHTVPAGLRGEASDLPCVLLFPANRAIFTPRSVKAVARPSAWGYQPALRFETDGPEWDTSVDNLLVWLEWLNDTRIEELLDYLNKNVFAENGKTIRRPERELLTTYVSTATGTHPLTYLSHGERALLQFFARTLCHMTRNTVILIDEIELHLHTKWMNRFFQSLKTLLREVPSLSIVFTTHNRELIRLFDHTIPEEGLIKGGFLIEEGLI
jgi:AAA domain, putative AbiEii toxin, Type IV TA system/AAA domain